MYINTQVDKALDCLTFSLYTVYSLQQKGIEIMEEGDGGAR